MNTSLSNPTVLITGANGLVGKTLSGINRKYKFKLFAFGKEELDITREETVKRVLGEIKPDYIINCAAYTQVDKAEIEKEKCFRVNVTGTEYLVREARSYGSVFIHLSTDYVFDGKKKQPYVETDIKNPVNYYGITKSMAEDVIRNYTEKFFIIRPAWIYGLYGKNFFQNLLKWFSEKNMLKISDDQTSTPTLAEDLADFIFFLIRSESKKYGIFHFTNGGETTRYGMALAVKEFLNLNVEIVPAPSSVFTPLAQRPAYSVLSKEKVKSFFDYPIIHWKESLKKFIHKHYV